MANNFLTSPTDLWQLRQYTTNSSVGGECIPWGVFTSPEDAQAWLDQHLVATMHLEAASIRKYVTWERRKDWQYMVTLDSAIAWLGIPGTYYTLDRLQITHRPGQTITMEIDR